VAGLTARLEDGLHFPSKVHGLGSGGYDRPRVRLSVRLLGRRTSTAKEEDADRRRPRAHLNSMIQLRDNPDVCIMEILVFLE
jgi:hypothetical protein